MCLGNYVQLWIYLGVHLVMVSWLCHKVPTEHTLLNAVTPQTSLYVVEEILLPQTHIAIFFVVGVSLRTQYSDNKSDDKSRYCPKKWDFSNTLRSVRKVARFRKVHRGENFSLQLDAN